MIRPSDVLYGYCGGCFDGDDSEQLMVMAVTRRWIVVAVLTSDEPEFRFHTSDDVHRDLAEYLTPPDGEDE